MRILILALALLSAAWFGGEPPHTDYETVAASQSDQALGPTGGAGDVLERLIIVPLTTGAGTVTLKDGSGGAISVFISGTLSDLHTIVVPIGARSTSGAWKVTTGANVNAIAVGRFQ